MKLMAAGLISALVVCLTGCAWPTATYIRGQADIAFAASDSPQAEEPPRVVIIKYWRIQQLFNSDRRAFEFFGAELADSPVVAISFPLKFYTAIWTPALGTQHLLPDAGLVAFAEGRWPSHVIADSGRRCCEAPSSGRRHWHLTLLPMDRPPDCRPPDEGDRDEFPPLTVDKLESVLRRNSNLTPADREMCSQQLRLLLEHFDQAANSMDGRQ